MIIVITVFIDSGPLPIVFEKIRKSEPNPSTPRPTTPMPITEPPANAILSPSPKLVRAPCVVRTFAFVATRMPI